MKALLRTLLIGGHTPPAVASDVFLTIARIGFGLMMAVGHGYEKLPPPERFIDRVGNLGFPMPTFFAWVAVLSEFLGGILLALGLFTRPAAFFIGFTMLIAAFMRHWDDPLFAAWAEPDQGSKEMALLFLCGTLVYLGAGSGRFSIDFLLRNKL